MGHVIQKQQVQVVQNEPEIQSEEVRGQLTFVHLVRPDVIDLGFLYRNVWNNQNIL